jgi:hypothetical protein
MSKMKIEVGDDGDEGEKPRMETARGGKAKQRR